MKRYILFSDFDGTMTDSKKAIHKDIIKEFHRLSAKNIIRVIASGRSLYSAQQVLSEDFPIDYLIFSSGAGIYDWHKQEVIYTSELSKNDCQTISEILFQEHADFMIHREIPHNHYFDYYFHHKDNQDFFRRLSLYQPFASLIPLDHYQYQACSQFLVIDQFHGQLIQHLKEQLKAYSIIQATSPLDHQSLWIEIFNAKVSKSQSAQYLCDYLNIPVTHSMAIGNDLNDEDLLEWAEHSFIVNNAHQNLHGKHKHVASCHDNGILEAIEIWLKSF